GLFPYSKRYLGTLENHFSTIGINGVNEMIRNFTLDEYDITDPRGHAMAVRLLDHVRDRMVEFQEETGNLYNLEATPAEGTTYRFAKEDAKRFPGILQAGTEANPYYTNSSQLPVGFTDDAFEALERQEELQGKYTGGTVLHLYMPEQVSSVEACKNLVKRSLTNFRLPYITITPTFSICPVHGYLAGEHHTCPKCAAANPDAPQDCEVWTRVMGYFRPVSSFNIGKKGEYAERVMFTEDKAAVHL
ncbi:MAG: ribonucleoside triphosphate reductase, partial [Actinobacteria bacterium]|nr:ribonucleoside triphosphate reductase [Actinomycetota bacterium]